MGGEMRLRFYLLDTAINRAAHGFDKRCFDTCLFDAYLGETLAGTGRGSAA
jgi:hypothetical protein